MTACPTPTKKAWDSKTQAKKAIPRRTGDRLRVYRCPCGAWHLTSLVGPR